METFTDAWAPRTEAWLARPPSEWDGATGRPLFVCGCPRSGTTLLRAILDNHPGIAMPLETSFVLPLWHQRTRFGDLRGETARRAVAEWVFSPERGGGRLRGDLPRPDAIDRVAREAAPSAGGVVAACFRLYAEHTRKPRWGDKRPRYAMFAGALLDLFPDAQLVNVVRDPRAAVASQIPMGWDPPAVVVEASAANWEVSVHGVERAARRLAPDQLIDVRYEDLVRDPSAELTRICAFAGLSADDVPHALTASRGGASGDLRRFTRDITPDRVATWRERLTAEQAALVEHAAGPHLARFGYVPLHAGTPVPRASLAEYRRQRRSRRSRLRRAALRELVRRAPAAAPPGSGAVS